MAYVTVPKDLNRVKTKVALNLTRRQLICFSAAGLVGIPLYLLTRNALGNDLAALLMVMVMLPLFAFALYEKDGMPLEAFIENYFRVRFLYPHIRPYQTENFYRLIQSEINHRKEIRISAAKKKCNK
ncbi:MAG: PrgI family protein [Anaerolineaceae bacterium]